MSLGSVIRHLLLRKGLMLHRLGTDLPPGMVAYLRALHARGVRRVCCLDNELTIQADLLGVFPENAVIFSYPVIVDGALTPPPGASWPAKPDGRFVVVIDVNSFDVGMIVTHLPWLASAEAVLIRGCVETFWSGSRDWAQIDSSLQRLGLNATELVDSPFPSPLRAPAGRIVFAWARNQEASPDQSQRRRVLEAKSYLSAPLVAAGTITTLAGRGGFGFAAGLCNPGAVHHEEYSLLLARSERTPWSVQKKDPARFFQSSGAFLLELDSAHRIAKTQAVELENADLPSPCRIEDFRLFRFHGKIIANHVVISPAESAKPVDAALRLDQLQTRIGISVLDPVERKLRWHGWPAIDRTTSQTEKNWAMFTAGEDLHLLYSFSPYILLRCTDWPKLRFETVVNTSISAPFSGDGLTLRNSINPIDYDDRHLLHVVHRVYPGKQYTFWPVLIKKKTLRPARVGSRPLACGGRSHTASILYLSSALAAQSHVDFFFGLDDAALGWSRVTREQLDSNWVTLEGGK